VLRPDAPGARLAHMPSVDAVMIYRWVSLLVILILCGRMVVRIAAILQAPPEALAAGRIAAHLILFAIFVQACLASRAALASWFATLLGRGGVGQKFGKYWLAVAVPLFAALVAAQVFAAGAGSAAVPNATLFTLNAVMAVLFLRTLVRAAQDRLVDHAGSDSHAASLFGLVTRCASAGLLIILGLLVARAWIVDVFGTVDATSWQAFARSSAVSGVILFIAYVSLELVRFFTRLHKAERSPGMLSEEDQQGVPASRLVTLMPLMRTTLVVFVVVIATLVLLSQNGVNITPLIAGASIFGLALSFGSQTLVRDVVSGIFYLADDAFRVGEYIDCGKAKGTVEGFTLRSIRLRHQNGQVHTIPFGQLGQITNFSRDWTTVKFNLRFARETEVEKLRKAVKRLGQEMLEDPELKDEFLAPLKMQGIVDVAENALVVRFKFTVRPGKPSFIQREAVKRLIRVCREAGVEFASSLVSVQTHGAALDQITAGAAVQSALQRKSSLEAGAVDINAHSV
jgi:moderate conductance mechanosensitive channel